MMHKSLELLDERLMHKLQAVVVFLKYFTLRTKGPNIPLKDTKLF